MDLVTPGIGLVFWTAITFIFLLLIMRKFAWKPILGAVSEREESIKNALDAAEEAKKEMQNLQVENNRILKEARAECDTLLKEAAETKNKIVKNAKEESKVEANKIIKRAQATIESEKKAAVADIKSQIANLSIEIAKKVIKDQLVNKDKQLQLVEEMVGDIKLN